MAQNVNDRLGIKILRDLLQKILRKILTISEIKILLYWGEFWF